MSVKRRLFLLGGSAAFEAVAGPFVAAAGGREARIVLQQQGSAGWKKYVPQYALPWRRRRVTQIWPVVPDESGALDIEAVSALLDSASGIFIGGGHTPPTIDCLPPS